MSSTIANYFVPAPVTALYNAWNGKRDFITKYTLLNSSIALFAYLAEPSLKAQLGKQYDNSAAIAAIFFTAAVGQTIFARLFFASARGCIKAFNNRSTTDFTRNFVVGALACVASSKGIEDLFYGCVSSVLGK
jgi:hypothetical protein